MLIYDSLTLDCCWFFCLCLTSYLFLIILCHSAVNKQSEGKKYKQKSAHKGEDLKIKLCLGNVKNVF